MIKGKKHSKWTNRIFKIMKIYEKGITIYLWMGIIIIINNIINNFRENSLLFKWNYLPSLKKLMQNDTDYYIFLTLFISFSLEYSLIATILNINNGKSRILKILYSIWQEIYGIHLSENIFSLEINHTLCLFLFAFVCLWVFAEYFVFDVFSVFTVEALISIFYVTFCISTWISSTFFFIVVSRILAKLLKGFENRLKTIITKREEYNSLNNFRSDYEKVRDAISKIDKILKWYNFYIYAPFIPKVCLILYLIVYGSIQYYIKCMLSMWLGTTTLTLIVITLNAGEIYLQASCPLNVINILPFQMSTQEYFTITRLLDKINSSEIGLTCLGFFVIKKSLIFKILGATITYVLIFIQLRSLFL